MKDLEPVVSRLEQRLASLEDKNFRLQLQVDSQKSDFMLLIFALANIAVVVAAYIAR